MNREVLDALDARRKLAVLQYAEGIGNVTEACRDFNVPRSTFYRWKRAYLKEGRLRNRPVCSQTSAFLGTGPNLLNRAHSRSGVPT